MNQQHQDLEAARQELRQGQEEGRALGVVNLYPHTLESMQEDRDAKAEEIHVPCPRLSVHHTSLL